MHLFVSIAHAQNIFVSSLLLYSQQEQPITVTDVFIFYHFNVLPLIHLNILTHLFNCRTFSIHKSNISQNVSCRAIKFPSNVFDGADIFMAHLPAWPGPCDHNISRRLPVWANLFNWLMVHMHLNN